MSRGSNKREENCVARFNGFIIAEVNGFRLDMIVRKTTNRRHGKKLRRAAEQKKGGGFVEHGRKM
ncbi:MAG: hypothetical protein PWQ41_583 [Bacillota bacterium]|nr:hypothetical protein [Bacillota bacterium]MDK2924809.1 hypothetical protein [Bacillota bacterium]